MSLKRLLCQSFVSVDLLSVPLYSVLLNAGRGAAATDPLGPELIAGRDPAPPPPLSGFLSPHKVRSSKTDSFNTAGLTTASSSHLFV